MLAFVGGLGAAPTEGASPETLLAFSRTATLLGWAAGLVLVMTCASVTGLLLARATGRTVLMTTQVDPSIVGGIVARVGGTVFDASVTNQLQRMKHRLEESI